MAGAERGAAHEEIPEQELVRLVAHPGGADVVDLTRVAEGEDGLLTLGGHRLTLEVWHCNGAMDGTD